MWKCQLRDALAAVAGQGAEPLASACAAGPSQRLSLTEPENIASKQQWMP